MKSLVYRIFTLVYLIGSSFLFIHYSTLIAEPFSDDEINSNETNSKNDPNIDLELKKIRTNIGKEKILTNTFSHIQHIIEKTELDDIDKVLIDTVINYLNYKRSLTKNKTSTLHKKTLYVINLLEKLKNNNSTILSEEDKLDICSVLNDYLQSFRTANNQDLFNVIQKDPSRLTEVQTIIIDNMIIPYMIKNKTFIESSNISLSTILISENFLFTKKENGIGFFKNVSDLRIKTLKRLIDLNVDNLSFYIHEYFYRHIVQDEFTDPETREFLQNIFIDYYIFPWMDTHNSFPLYKNIDINRIKLINKSSSRLALFDSMQHLQQLVKKRASDLGIMYKYPFFKKDFSIDYQDQENLQQQREEAQEIIIDQYILPWIYKNKMFPTNKQHFGTDTNRIGIPYYTLIRVNSKTSKYIFTTKEELLEKTKKRIKELGLENKFSFLSAFFFNNLTDNELKDINIKIDLQRQFILDHLFPFLDKNTSFSDYKFPKITQILKIDSINVYFLINKQPSNTESLFDSESDLKEIAFHLWFSDSYHSVIYPNINPVIFLTNNLLANKQIRDWAQDYFIQTVMIPFVQTETLLPTISNITQFRSHKYKLLIPIDTLINTVSKKDHATIEKYGIFDSIENLHYKLRDYIINKYIFPWIKEHGRFPNIDDFGSGYNQINIDFSIIRTIFSSSYDLEQYIKAHYCKALFMINNN